MRSYCGRRRHHYDRYSEHPDPPAEMRCKGCVRRRAKMDALAEARAR